MKKRLFTISLLAICLSLCIGGTVAYFTASEIATNVITAGSIEIELIETGEGEKPFENMTGVVPGEKIAKKVTLKNTAENPCWVRIKVGLEIELASGETGDTGLLLIDFNDTVWTGKDGYYYYNEALEPGEETEALFETVTFDPAMGNEYQNCTARITVAGQAVQSKNNGDAVLDAKGWPAE